MAQLRPAGAAPSLIRPVSAAGDSGSAESLRKLQVALAELRAQAVVPVLQEALARLRTHDIDGATALARQALAYDGENGLGWYVLAISREKASDFPEALEAYEKALALLPEQAAVANDLGRLAHRLGMLEVAEKLFHRFLAANPGAIEGVNNLACTLRDQMRFDEAIELLRPMIYAEPEQPMLWNTLGSVLTEQGDMATAAGFYDEALRLDPGFTKARYNRANARLSMGDAGGGLHDVEQALSEGAQPDELAMMAMARAHMLLASGDLARGWPAYEARLDPLYSECTRFLTNRPRWTPGEPLAGRRLLVIGEQGLGDEVMFCNVIPDVLEALGPEGTLILAVEPRLVPLFQRSFPTARVEPHGTVRLGHQLVRTVLSLGEWDDVDVWAPVASLLGAWRPTPGSFPATPYLTPDPERVAHWRAELASYGPGPKVGVLWKSLLLDAGRARYFSPFDAWAPVLRTPGVTFVNLQYGEVAAELAEARDRLGVTIRQPQGIDLRADLDDVAALTCALDLLIGPSNATQNLAAACGVPVWLITTPGAWARLGTNRYPWYASVRCFTSTAYGEWTPVMARVAEALAELA